jgi:hypothetical protein
LTVVVWPARTSTFSRTLRRNPVGRTSMLKTPKGSSESVYLPSAPPGSRASHREVDSACEAALPLELSGRPQSVTVGTCDPPLHETNAQGIGFAPCRW